MEETIVSNPIVEQLLTEVRDLLAHPAMTTSFADYNVIEALLLLLFFGAYLWAGYTVVKGGDFVALVIAEFLGVIGVDFVPPTNLAELIPYLLTVFIGVFLVAAVFRLIGGITRALFVARRF